MCYCPLPLEESVAEAHVDECLGSAVRESDASSDSEVYEEYTWCNVTRVRATSMLTPEARASKIRTERTVMVTSSYLPASLPLQICLMEPLSLREMALRVVAMNRRWT